MVPRIRRLLPRLFLFGCIIVPLGTYGLVRLPSELFSPKPRTLRIQDRHGETLAEIPSDSARSQQPLKLEEMGEFLPRITIALEDHRFYEHHGVDFFAVFAAALRNLQSPVVLSGASTITQQTVKLATARRGRAWSSKLFEAIAAVKLERKWDKNRILEEYLNRTHYGNRLIGPEAASRAYFEKPARDLAFNEALFLAGLPQAPTRFNPWGHYELAKAKYLRSVDRLEALGMIKQTQAVLLRSTCPQVRRNLPPRFAPHFVDAVTAQYAERSGALRTTLDLPLQRAVDLLVSAHLQELEARGVSNLALVVVDNATGGIRAMAGSGDYRKSQINGAMTPRSCGSTLKPFVYLYGIEHRQLTAATILPDTSDAIRTEFFDYDPQNYTRRHYGPVRMREALASSLNVPAVMAVGRLGARNVFFALQKWGFQFPRTLGDYGAGFVLGNAEIRLVDLAAAYAALARGGIAVPASFLESDRPPGLRIASQEAVAIITDVLTDNEARRLNFSRNSPLNTPVRIAVKTGTSSGFRDALVVGYSRDHTVAVWAGNFDGRPMQELPAVRAAAPLWRLVMNYLLANGSRPLPPISESETLKRLEICSLTGELPCAESLHTTGEWFLAGTEPKESAEKHFMKVAGTPKLVLPVEYSAWCRSSENYLGAMLAPASDLKITQPRENTVFQLDPLLGPSQQMLELTATVQGDLQWFVNGNPVSPRPDGRYFWRLQPGENQVEVVVNGARAASRFLVQQVE